MTDPVSRRDALKQLGAVGAGLVLGGSRSIRRADSIVVGGRQVQVAVASIGPRMVRISLRPVVPEGVLPVPPTGELTERASTAAPERTGRTVATLGRVRAGQLVVSFDDQPLVVRIEHAHGALVQALTFDAVSPTMSFRLGNAPVLGLGEGGPQFDRRGSADRMVNGESHAQLATNGTRAPIQWLVGTDGWAMFIHHPRGAFELSASEGRFTPPVDAALPYDVFVVGSHDPAEIMREYARITGLPELPPRWGFGYLQSHRTLAGPQEIASVAHTLREKRLPCEALIYLGTGFSPSGWNTKNGDFDWNAANFPQPKAQVSALHDQHFRVVLHVVLEGRRLTGTVHDPCTAPPLPSGTTPDGHWPRARQVACYWPSHRSVMTDVGIDGWWPDQGDGLDGPSEVNRHRMYWEGTQLWRPNERPFALHRNASPGVQRYGGFIWSGDVASRWETLRTHVPVGINTALSGLPYWGTDIGGFYPTKEYTGELFVRWFQFAAFCPLFRSHGRNWHLHLPWGWDGGDGGPDETRNFHADPATLHDKRVEPICRQYMELRSRLMPYLYTAVREGHDTGMPVMRALWLHYPDDAAAVSRGDEYLWGRDLLVAPVVEQGAATRRVYLPPGTWYDWWTEQRVTGGGEIERAVDLATMPLYARAGAVIPLGPVKQYDAERPDAPMMLVVFPGADGRSAWYEDDGESFDYRRGEWMRVDLAWHDATRRLTLRLVPGSRALAPMPRRIDVRVAGSAAVATIAFTGRPASVTL
ncbi:MAG TPA: TIM-barrel domain-containing protein [Gemmatimonadaceae bacterium]|nr:TIM-barrel domain-containing protein [Gemmatimonadaceae bacterium]